VEATEALDEAEAARLVEAAAAEALRNRLEDADAELTSLTLALEEQRREAEETLTLLAAADAAREDLATRLAAALAQVEARGSLEEQLAAAQLEAERMSAQLTTGPTR
jgi:chemotaxis protein MotB